MESMGVAEGAKITTSSGLCGRAGGSLFAAGVLHCPKRTLRSFVRSFRKSRPPSHSFRGNPCTARALHAHCALLLDYVPLEEPLGTPLGNALRIRLPKLPQLKKIVYYLPFT